MPLPSRLGGPGSVMGLLSGVQGGAPVANAIVWYLEATEAVLWQSGNTVVPLCMNQNVIRILTSRNTDVLLVEILAM